MMNEAFFYLFGSGQEAGQSGELGRSGVFTLVQSGKVKNTLCFKVNVACI